jgi:hypothetical protein
MNRSKSSSKNNPFFFSNESNEPVYMNNPNLQKREMKITENKLYNKVSFVKQFQFNGSLQTTPIETLEVQNIHNGDIGTPNETIQQYVPVITHILQLYDVFQYITLGGTLEKNDFTSLETYVKDQIYIKRRIEPIYIELVIPNPITGMYKSQYTLKYTMKDYHLICKSIFSWMDIEDNKLKIQYLQE